MPIPLAPVPLLIAISTALGLILAVWLLGRRSDNRQSSRFLAGAVIAYALSNLGAIPWPNGTSLSHPALLDAFMPLFFLIGPFLYLHVRSRLEGGLALRPGLAVHFSAFGLAVIGYGMLFLRTGSSSARPRIPHGAIRPEPWWLTAYLVIRFLFVLVYAGLALRAIRRAKGDPGKGSAASSRGTAGLRALILAYGAAAPAGLISVRLGLRLDLPIHLWMTMAILLLGLLGTATGGPDAGDGKPGRKYLKAALPDEQVERIERLLVALMENDRLFLEPEISLPVVAEKLGVAPGSLSRVLNARMNRGFRDYLNGFRVEEARRLLRDPRRRDQKILAIALDAGFNSKVVFNRVFKKHTGRTPSAYRHRPDSPDSPRG